MKTLNRIAATKSNHGHTTAKAKKARGFQFKIEYHPNQNMITIHTKKMFPPSATDSISMCLDEKRYRKGNKHALIKSIRRFTGVLKVSSDHYELSIEKAELFTWEEILPKVRRALKKHFAAGKELNELPAQGPSPDQLAFLRSQGCNV
jgi:hypothetical protein